MAIANVFEVRRTDHVHELRSNHRGAIFGGIASGILGSHAG
jgi:hypothetical protein